MIGNDVKSQVDTAFLRNDSLWEITRRKGLDTLDGRPKIDWSKKVNPWCSLTKKEYKKKDRKRKMERLTRKKNRQK